MSNMSEPIKVRGQHIDLVVEALYCLSTGEKPKLDIFYNSEQKRLVYDVLGNVVPDTKIMVTPDSDLICEHCPHIVRDDLGKTCNLYENSALQEVDANCLGQLETERFAGIRFQVGGTYAAKEIVGSVLLNGGLNTQQILPALTYQQLGEWKFD